MGFKSAFEGLIEGADIVRIINPYPANVQNRVSVFSHSNRVYVEATSQCGRNSVLHLQVNTSEL
jgi:hypothetical protein